MATILLKGEPIGVGGRFPRPGDIAHSFMLVNTDLKDVSLSQYAGKRKIIAVVPSLDAAIGLTIARRLNNMADQFQNTITIIVSVDTPYAQARIVAVEEFRNIVTLSTLRGRDFHKDYGVMITDYPLSGLMATAIVVMDENDVVLHSELVAELTSEPNYQAIIDTLTTPQQ
ncbi:thiol peroxidase [Chitinivorax tropicus]|uniref:Thiol peroxidase n=1 Tax=Chitinivorax tropicus TaxID=714531 RepID=A0A840MGC1_9PROT|nr:thiol peroxidase [Chitinivorax tropicus]MBB5017450.1 thiol peroxidase [Chitinivorax tropicus]